MPHCAQLFTIWLLTEPLRKTILRRPGPRLALSRARSHRSSKSLRVRGGGPRPPRAASGTSPATIAPPKKQTPGTTLHPHPFSAKLRFSAKSDRPAARPTLCSLRKIRAPPLYFRAVPASSSPHTALPPFTIFPFLSSSFLRLLCLFLANTRFEPSVPICVICG